MESPTAQDVSPAPRQLKDLLEEKPKAKPVTEAIGEKTEEKESKKNPARLLALLKKNLHARVAYDAKSKQIVLMYDWTSKQQLEDFDLQNAKVPFTRGRLSLRPGESIRHLVDFKEVTIAVPVLVPQMRGEVLKTSGGVVASVGGANPDTMYLRGGGGDMLAMIVPEVQRKGIQPIMITITPTRLAFAYGVGKPSQLGKAVTDFHAGQVELFGGGMGFQYGKLVLTGVIDDKWLESKED